MNVQPSRIGLVEIGSRSIRYVVFDVPGRVQEFSLRDNQNAEHRIDPLRILREDIRKLNETVRQLNVKICEHSCDVVCVYGTQLCRAIEDRFPGELSAAVRILSVEEEGKAAWVAGFLCQNEAEEKSVVTAIDLGNGSTEIARGRWDGETIAELKYTSIKIGSAQLMASYKSNRLSYFRALEKNLPSLTQTLRKAGIEDNQAGNVYVVGGVATKIGWQKERKNAAELYRPERLNGLTMKLDTLSDLVLELEKMYATNPEECAKWVDPRHGSEKDVLRVLSGAPYLWGLVTSVHMGDSFRFSGYGVRHGMTYLLKHGLISASPEERAY